MTRAALALALLAACGDAPIGQVSAALWDGGTCETPDARLYELRFLPVDTDCGDVRTRVRRLDGPSDTGWCVMEPAGAGQCGVRFVETCDDLVIVGEVIRDPDWRGVADVRFRDEDGAEVCAGRYDVRTREVYP